MEEDRDGKEQKQIAETREILSRFGAFSASRAHGSHTAGNRPGSKLPVGLGLGWHRPWAGS